MTAEALVRLLQGYPADTPVYLARPNDYIEEVPIDRVETRQSTVLYPVRETDTTTVLQSRLIILIS